MTRASSLPIVSPDTRPSAEDWRAVLDAVDDAIFLHDARTGRVLDVNRSACELYGWPREEFRRLRIGDLSSRQPPYTETEAVRWVSRAAAEGPQRFEWHARDRRGRLFWVEVSLRHTQFPDGPKVVASVRDISERRRAARALRESEERFQSAFRDAGIGMALSAADGRCLQANRSLCRLLGYREEELQGRNFFDLTHPEDREASRARLDSLLAGEVPTYQIEKRYLAKDGAVIWASVNVSAVRDAAGRPLYQICQVEDVTERRRAAEALRESEQRYQNAFRHAAIGMALCAPDGSYLQVNAALCAMLGYEEEELRRLSFREVTHPEDREASQSHWDRLLAGEISDYRLDKRYLTRGGELRWVSVDVTLARDSRGAPLHSVSQIQDVTERRVAEEALRASEERYRQLVETMTDGLVVRDPEGRIRYVNQRFCELLDLARADIVGRDVEDFLDEASRGVYRSQVAKRPSGGKESYELTWISRTGTRVVTRMAPHPLFGQDGSFQGSFAVASDITERRRAEEELRGSEERFRLLVETMGDGLAARDEGGCFTYVNRRFCDMVGYTREELLGRPITYLLDDPNRDLLARQRATRADGTREPYTLTFTRRDGSAVTAIVSPQWLYDAQGRFRTGFAVVTDITERARAEQALLESEKKYRSLIETTGTGFVVADHEGRIVDGNAEYVRLTGHDSLEEILGRSALEWTAPADRERNAAAIARCQAGSVLRNFTVEYVGANGVTTPLEINATVIETAHGRRILGLCQDVSERRAAERERQRSQSLETVGRLAGGVAHDFNNILGSILGSVYVARMELGGGGTASGELDQIQALCRRGGDLTRQLLTVARRRAGEEEVVDVRGEVEEVRALLERTLPRDIRLAVELAEGLPAVRADRSLFTTVLFNLALNARDAMPAGGRLGLRVAPHRDDAGAPWLEVEVTDSGEGIPEALQDRIFEPFFTTKTGGAGTGLGLSTVQAAVQGWGGDIRVASAPGRGSTFTVRLPVWAGPRAAGEGLGSSTASAHPLTQAPLLVVEDEDGVARLMTLTLETWGYTVVRAANGLEALERLQERRGAFGLVILDLVLPELGGEQVYRVLRGLAPEVPVLLVSGREDLARKLAPRGPSLTKPFTGEEFLDGVARALRAGA